MQSDKLLIMEKNENDNKKNELGIGLLLIKTSIKWLITEKFSVSATASYFCH